MNIGYETLKNFGTEERINRSKIIADELCRFFTDTDKKSALDYGCGMGLVDWQLSKKFKTLWLVDSFAEVIEELNRNRTLLNEYNISTACFDIMQEVPENIRVDYVFSSLLLHHIKDTEEALRCLRSILNDGGRLLLVDLDEDDGGFHLGVPDFDGHNGFKHEDLVEKAKRVGFSQVTISTFYNGIKVIEEISKEIPYSLFILDAISGTVEI